MSEILVCCGGLPPPKRGKKSSIELDVSPDAPPDKRLHLDCQWISKRLADDIPPTRARDLLIVPVCGDKPIGNWLEVLDPMLYPPPEARRQSELAPGCPAFGEDSVVERGPQGHAPAIGAVRPGLHRPMEDGPSIVWWDPTVLSLDIEEQAPLRHQRILEIDAEGAAAAASEKNYVAWKEARETFTNAGGTAIAVGADGHVAGPL